MYEECVGKEMLLEEAAKLRYKVAVCGIYSITNKIDSKVYVGQSKDVYVRASDHARHRCSNEYLQHSIKKHGIVSFVHKIEFVCEEEELDINEIAIFDEYKTAGTVMYNVAKCGFGGNTMKYASKEQNAVRGAKISAGIKDYLANRTAEEIAKTNAKISTARKDYLANRTAEEIAKTSAKVYANNTAKFCNIVEATIKFCLQNKLFAFCKYKNYCIANNLEVQVSVAYFDRIMKFATYKEQLAEFISIYKQDMDYNTYISHCKLKPITKEVFLVTVKYSTYKYFI